MALLTSPEPVAGEVAELVRRAQAGDHPAFEALYARFARYVHGVVLARRGPADADDLVQDVFLAAFERLHRLREPAAFAGWIGAIARTRALDAARAGARHPEAGLDLARATRAAPGHAPDTLAEAACLLDVIRALPEAYRETLVLRLVEGMSGPEIAVATGLTADSVRVNLHRGMRLLREQLGMPA